LTASKLNEIDKKLLQLAQDEFPITRRPWAALGSKLKITEEEVMSRLKRLHREGIIRKIGPILDARKLGLCASTLIAMKVPEEKLESVVDIINEYKSVSHNYLREHEYNLWFTITTSSKEELKRTVEEIKRRTEIPDTDVLDLPTSRRFKIDVRFQFT
jgi:DNA-binding Lrp family transcriptional regulator